MRQQVIFPIVRGAPGMFVEKFVAKSVPRTTQSFVAGADEKLTVFLELERQGRRA
jgi:hypothetical protein